jgi:AhpC/TSA family
MTMIGARGITIVVTVAALFVPACGGDSPQPRSGSGAPSETGRAGESQTAPDFRVQTFAGDQFRLSEQRGTPVVLNFWESW